MAPVNSSRSPGWKLGAGPAYTLHFTSCTPNAGPYQEYNAAPHPRETWFEPSLEVTKGALRVPTGPGLGLTIDPQLLREAKPVSP